jgi:DNA-binding FadR family transcriptional regulator
MADTLSLAPSRETDFEKVRAFVDAARRSEQRRLPPEVQLSQNLGVSRARLRWILKRLEAEGLIWRHVGKGTFLGERSLTSTLDTLPDRLNPQEAFEARLVIEPQLTALAALRATPRQIAEMRDCLAQMESLTNFPDWAIWDERLHRLVAKAAGNTLLLALYDTVRESAPSGMRDRLRVVFGQSPRVETNVEHREYVDAIANRDAARHHLQSVRQALFGDR